MVSAPWVVVSLCWKMGQLRLKGLNSKVLRSPGPIQPHSSPSMPSSYVLPSLIVWVRF